MSLIGIDVSNDVFDAAMKNGDSVQRRQFTNTPNGHHAFCQWALRRSHHARVCLDATGVYHLQLALVLHRHPDIEVMVVNPCAARRFAQAHMVRAKTDAAWRAGLTAKFLRASRTKWTLLQSGVLEKAIPALVLSE